MPEEVDALRILVIYRRPLDYPDAYVVRAQRVIMGSGQIRPDAQALVFAIGGDDAGALEAARAVCEGMTCLGRMPDDEPQIVESWI